MKFQIKSNLQTQESSDQQTVPSQEMSFVTNQANFSLGSILNRVRTFISSLDPEESQCYIVQMSINALTNNISFQLIRQEIKKHQFDRQKNISYLEDTIKKYQKTQQTTLEKYNKIYHKMLEAKKFIQTWRFTVQQNGWPKLLHKQLSIITDNIEEPLLKNRTFSEDTNATFQDKQDLIQKFITKFEHNSTVYYPSCLFEVD